MKRAEYYLRNADKLKYFNWCKALNKQTTLAEESARLYFKNDPILKSFLPEIPIYFNENKKFIMDFYSIKYLCCIEIDGEYHENPQQQSKDRKREGRMRMAGIYTVRVDNKRLLDNPSETLKYIKTQIKKKKFTKRERAWIKKGQPHRVVNRILKRIDHERFNLPDSIRQRRVEQYAEHLPEFIVQFFSANPEATKKEGRDISLTGGEKATLPTKNMQVRELRL